MMLAAEIDFGPATIPYVELIEPLEVEEQVDDLPSCRMCGKIFYRR